MSSGTQIQDPGVIREVWFEYKNLKVISVEIDI